MLRSELSHACIHDGVRSPSRCQKCFSCLFHLIRADLSKNFFRFSHCFLQIEAKCGAQNIFMGNSFPFFIFNGCWRRLCLRLLPHDVSKRCKGVLFVTHNSPQSLEQHSHERKRRSEGEKSSLHEYKLNVLPLDKCVSERTKYIHTNTLYRYRPFVGHRDVYCVALEMEQSKNKTQILFNMNITLSLQMNRTHKNRLTQFAHNFGARFRLPAIFISRARPMTCRKSRTENLFTLMFHYQLSDEKYIYSFESKHTHKNCPQPRPKKRCECVKDFCALGSGRLISYPPPLPKNRNE